MPEQGQRRGLSPMGDPHQGRGTPRGCGPQRSPRQSRVTSEERQKETERELLLTSPKEVGG